MDPPRHSNTGSPGDSVCQIPHCTRKRVAPRRHPKVKLRCRIQIQRESTLPFFSRLSCTQWQFRATIWHINKNIYMFAPWLLISRASFLWRGQNNVLSACASPAQCDRNLSQLEDQNWCLCGYLTNQALNAKEAGRCSKSVVHYPATIFGRRGRERERERQRERERHTHI